MVHQHKRVKHHRLARVIQRADRLDHSSVRRRTAIDRTLAHLGNLLRSTACQPRHDPRHVLPVRILALYLGPDRTGVTAQIVPEPRHHQRHRPAVLQFAIQNLQRLRKVGLARGRVHIGTPPTSLAIVIVDRRRGQGIFPRAGDQRHPLHRLRHLVGIAFFAGLLGADAKALQPQIVHHHVSRPAIGRHLPRALDRLDRGIGQLVMCARIDTHVQLIRRQLLAIRPNAPHAQDFTRAQRNR